MSLYHRVCEAFSRHFGDDPPPHLFQAPGRVNLIGEHTDYNDGFVLPVAIDRRVVVMARGREDTQVHVYALDFAQGSHFALDDVVRDAEAPWSNYVRGVAWALQETGIALRGVDAVISGEVPIGAGLSSSAALEVAVATAFLHEAGARVAGPQLALICQRAENEFVGMHCGVMDQFVVALAQADHALFLDCRSLEYRHVPLPDEVRIVVCDSGVRRDLVTSAYNERRAQCEEAVQRLREHLPDITALRDVSVADFQRLQDKLPPPVRQRAAHVIHENQRVLDAVAALERGDLEGLGCLMDESHCSLRDLYEVSCPELDTLVEIVRGVPGCLGARLTGAGFGGCTVNLVQEEAVEAVVAAVQEEYPRRTGYTPHVYVCAAASGAGYVECGEIEFCRILQELVKS